MSTTAADDGWVLRLAERDWQFAARLGVDGWAVTEPAGAHGGVVPVAVSGGWDEAGALRFDVLFLETPTGWP